MDLINDPLYMLKIGIGTMIPNINSSMRYLNLVYYKPGAFIIARGDYFSKWNIVGIDIQPESQFYDDIITTLLGNSTVKKNIDALLKDKMFNIIIDDGSHEDYYQLNTLLNLYPYVKPGGYYIIEDISTNNKLKTDYL